MACVDFADHHPGVFNTIVVGLDGSPRQPALLERAKLLAQTHGAKLHLVRAMHVPLSVPAIAWSLQGDEFHDFLVEHGTKALQHIADELGDSLVHGVTVVTGSPAEVLCEAAVKTRADLILVGSHGYDRIERFLGTTAAKVSNASPCSVLVIKA